MDEEQVFFSEILTSSNFSVDDELLDLNAEDMLKTLAQRQVTIEEEVINGIDDVLSGYTSLSSLTINSNENNLRNIADSQEDLNLFGPTATPFSLTVSFEDYSVGQKLTQINSVDRDGDAVSFSFESGNIDLDGDLGLAFIINSQGEVLVNDPDDLMLATGSTFNLLITLDDNNGKSSTVLGTITISNSDNGVATVANNLNAIKDNSTGWSILNGLALFTFEIITGLSCQIRLVVYSGSRNRCWVWDSTLKLVVDGFNHFSIHIYTRRRWYKMDIY